MEACAAGCLSTADRLISNDRSQQDMLGSEKMFASSPEEVTFAMGEFSGSLFQKYYERMISRARIAGTKRAIFKDWSPLLQGDHFSLSSHQELAKSVVAGGGEAWPSGMVLHFMFLSLARPKITRHKEISFNSRRLMFFLKVENFWFTGHQNWPYSRIGEKE